MGRVWARLDVCSCARVGAHHDVAPQVPWVYHRQKPCSARLAIAPPRIAWLEIAAPTVSRRPCCTDLIGGSSQCVFDPIHIPENQIPVHTFPEGRVGGLESRMAQRVFSAQRVFAALPLQLGVAAIAAGCRPFRLLPDVF